MAVFLEYEQGALDDAYDQAVYAPNGEFVRERGAANSATTRALLGEPERLAYGTTGVEHIELFRTAAPNAPVFAFIHGGAWRTNPLPRFSYIAEPFVRAGAHCALVQFAGIEDTGDMSLLVGHVRSAIAWVYRNAASFGGDPKKLFVGGHSSGAHLTSVALITDWAEYGLPADPLAGAILVSGMYDLEGVSLSKRSAYVRFDANVIDAFSAQRHLERVRTPLTVAYGTCETPEFQRLGREFIAALQAAGHAVEPIVAIGYNHFELIETIGSPYGIIGRAILRRMQLAS